jgi:hypothetical protein
MRSSNHAEVKVSVPEYDGVIRVLGVIYYPYCPATQIDPPEDAWVEYDAIRLEGSEHSVSAILHPSTISWIEQAVIQQITGN